eukprot:TRINITY_DN19081_c0_g1_i1.p1 TRINITY_DN19081_c0_g1~~TRINITY_DN19081_c0_g1_i1.p1  ORF type:complete len:572 (-),score=80.83 TRINITY_DN19081_c0_g1_i1:125-1771(-)
MSGYVALPPKCDSQEDSRALVKTKDLQGSAVAADDPERQQLDGHAHHHQHGAGKCKVHHHHHSSGQSGCSPLGYLGICCGFSCFFILMFLSMLLSLSGSAFSGISVGLDAPADAEYKVMLDGRNTIPVPRTVISGLAAELLFSIDSSKEDIRLSRNSTHIRIPFGREIRGRFLRETHFTDQKEHGEFSWIWFPNSVSVFGSSVKVGLAEKLHTRSLTTEEFEEGASSSDPKEDSRWWIVDYLASHIRWTRTLLLHMSMVTGRVGTQLFHAALDTDQVSETRDFVQKDEGNPSNLLQQQMAKMSTRMDDSPLEATDAEHSGLGCYSFEGDNGLDVESDSVLIPLGKKLVSYRSEAQLSGSRSFSILTGVSVFDYDAKTGMLQVYLAASSHLNLPAESNADDVKPVFALGSVDGTVQKEDQERADVRPKNLYLQQSILGAFLYGLYTTLPLDYGWLYENPHTACPMPMRKGLSMTLAALDSQGFTEGKPGASQSMKLVKDLTNAVICGAPFLTQDVPQSHGYDLFESLIFNQLIFEAPGRQRIRVVADWD